MGTRVVAAGLAVPPRIQSAAELAALIDRPEQWIIERTGVARRHVGEPSLASPVLAAQAARQALDGQAAPELIIYAGGVQHQAIPDTSVFLSRELGIGGVPCFSVDASCLSFLVAMHAADAFLTGGAYRRILICSADLATRARDMREPESACLLGDGAAAVLLEKSDGPEGALYFSMKTWPDGAELAEIRGGGTRVALDGPGLPENYLFHMQGLRLLKQLGPKVRELLDDCLREARVEAGGIDLVVPHQASLAGMMMLQSFGLPADRTINILADYGNCVAASLPMALATAMHHGRLAPGMLVLLLGTAAGTSAGGMLLRW